MASGDDGAREPAGSELPVDAPGEPDEWGGEAPRVPRPRTPPDAERPGPRLLVDDVWDADATDTTVVAETGEYAGRRRASAPSGRRWLLIGLILAGLAAVVVIPLTMASLLGVNDAAPPGSPPVVAPPDDFPSELPGPSEVSAQPPPGSATAGSTAAAPRTTTRRPRATTTATRRNPPPPAFAPLSIEAEAGGGAVTLGGAAEDLDYDGASGGRVVFHVGDWDMRAGPGSVRFNNVSIPATGRYAIAIHYVHPDGEPNRTAVVTISGVAPMNVSFQGNATCCQVKVIQVNLTAGTRTITIANNDGHAPSIDRVVVTRP